MLPMPMGWASLSFFLRKKGKEGEIEENIHVWLPLVCPLLGTWPAT